MRTMKLATKQGRDNATYTSHTRRCELVLKELSPKARLKHLTVLCLSCDRVKGDCYENECGSSN